MHHRTDLIYHYDGSFEGFLCCVFRAIFQKEDPMFICPQEEAQATLLETVVIDTEPDKAQRVRKSIPAKLGMDAQRDAAMPSGYRVYINGGRTATELDAREWAMGAVELGAGEIVLNSIDADGTRAGYEIELTRMISQAVSVPVVASGGGGTPAHLSQVLQEGQADAALIASMVHSGEYTVGSIKAELAKAGVPVR